MCNPWFCRPISAEKKEKHIGYFMICCIGRDFDFDLLQKVALKFKKKMAFYLIDDIPNDN